MIVPQRRRNTTETILQMVSALQEGPKSYAQLAGLTGLAERTVSGWIKSLRPPQKKQVYIAEYALDSVGRPFVPLWAWGDKPDAARPGQSRTPAERMRAMRQRRRKGVAC